MHEPVDDPPKLSSFPLERGYEDEDLDPLCEAIGQLEAKCGSGPVSTFDLRSATDFGPAALALLLGSVCKLAARPGRTEPLAILPPDSGEAPACLQPEPLRDLIEAGIGHWEERADGRLVGVETFAGAEGIDRVIAALQQNVALRPRLLSEASLRSLRTMTFELTENVVQHSEARRGLVVFEFRPGAGAFNLAIHDEGIGIRRSLTRNPKYQDLGDDLAAIASSMGAGATAEPGTGGGMGLFLARMVIRDNGGRLMLRSGDACREEEQGRFKNTTLLPPLSGTLVGVYARADSPFDYARIEEAMVQPAGVRDSNPFQAGPAT
jgi:anti-sigma regulatory factor (Ser/Thr protein kinase)